MVASIISIFYSFPSLPWLCRDITLQQFVPQILSNETKGVQMKCRTFVSSHYWHSSSIPFLQWQFLTGNEEICYYSFAILHNSSKFHHRYIYKSGFPKLLVAQMAGFEQVSHLHDIIRQMYIFACFWQKTTSHSFSFKGRKQSQLKKVDETEGVSVGHCRSSLAGVHADEGKVS